MPADTAAYPLPDEPRPSGLSRFVVQPLWPLLAVMFVGPWLSWPWFVFNAFALGSPRRLHQLGLALLGFVGIVGLLALLIAAGQAGLPREAIPYFVISLTVWKLGVSYGLQLHQERILAVHELYGGPVANGMGVLLLGWFVGARFLQPMLRETGQLYSLLLLP